MKRTLTYLAVSLCLALCGCLREGGLEDCPGNLYLSFYLDDSFEPGTYDSRIANDVQLYMFRNKKCVEAMLIPYERISGGQSCKLAKTPNMVGTLDLVAWAVPSNQPHSDIPEWPIGTDLDEQFLTEEVLPQNPDYYTSGPRELYRGRISIAEPVTRSSSYHIGMLYAACRVEVHVTDEGERLYPGLDLLHTRVNGTMSQMNMNLQGVGQPALVVASLDCPTDDRVHFDTDRFSVLPSAGDQIVSVDIRSSGITYATLNVPRNLLPRGAWAGGLLIFDYTLGNDYFTLILGGWRENIYDVSGL